MNNRWPHSPSHTVQQAGTYIVTAATRDKTLLFDTPAKLDYLEGSLLEISEEFGWQIQAWAVFPNHYHFVGHSPPEGSRLPALTGKLHATTARWLNKLDQSPGRNVWFQYWQTRITYEKSYFARLAYVHGNAVKHGLVRLPEDYKWCSSRWFQKEADVPFYETVWSFKTDRVSVIDNFEVFGSPSESGLAGESGAGSPHSKAAHYFEVSGGGGEAGLAGESGARSPHSKAGSE